MSFFFFRGTFFQGDINLLINYKKETLFFKTPAGATCSRWRPRPRQDHRSLPCELSAGHVYFQLKINLLSWCTDFFFSGGRSQAAQRNPPQDDTHPPQSGGQQPGVRLFSPHQSTFHQYHVTSFSDLYAVYWKKSPLRGLDNVPAELSPCVFLFPQPELTAPQSILQLLM